jgi:hypothetical protein
MVFLFVVHDRFATYICFISVYIVIAAGGWDADACAYIAYIYSTYMMCQQRYVTKVKAFEEHKLWHSWEVKSKEVRGHVFEPSDAPSSFSVRRAS